MEHYSSFFGLKENPFVLTPDPKYLYLGHKHREVMSHLLYGINEDKGFMVIVGEVGTGKTTLCRAFINQLMKENIEVGLIYNPAMTDLELLQAINREFKLDSNVDTKSGLVDALNEFLLNVNGEGRKVVLIIDEAQNLDPSVMEQIRLISNLETETRKLIQIILVGQPELERTLAKEEMRQLDQRVVVRGLLGPFKPKETINYLRHRLKVARIENGEGAVTFTDGACKNVHKRSGGIPRLINVLADRSLLVAYTQGKKAIDRKIVKSAHRDLERSRYRSGSGTFSLRWQTAAIFSLLVILFLGWFLGDVADFTGWRVEKPKPVRATTLTPPQKPPPKPVAAPVITPPAEVPLPIQEKKESPEQILDRFFTPLEKLTRQENWQLALATVFKMWEEDPKVLSGVATGTLPEMSTMYLREISGSMTLLRSLNMPAIVEVRRPRSNQWVYGVLRSLGDDRLVMLGENEEQIPLSVFNEIWYGHAYVLWKDFEELPRVIYPGTSSLAVTWLQHNLKTLNLFKGPVSGFYDQKTKQAVVRLQKENKLLVDGIVGSETKMIIYAHLDIYPKPTLIENSKKKEKE